MIESLGSRVQSLVGVHSSGFRVESLGDRAQG